ncbi:MAG: hypothetical protein ABUS57_14255, partial [Pseudomonadota bacterium]
MLSFVVYGRNDQHGYNLHRRAALSINALSQIMTGPGDELLFVDMGSPESVPTFPEAIDDVLTDAARARLRILRVRTGDLAVMGVTGRHIPEGVARNIGARRANPANQWLLFTNTDVLLAEPEPGALRTAIEALTDGFYHAPRHDLPNYLWEMLARTAPEEALAFLREHGERLGLRERVWTEPLVMFDNPGDFQLVRRADFAAIGGFDESMRRPFHVDSNFAARMRLHAGDVRPFMGVACYHCDHSRQITRMNDPGVPPNDPAVYVHGVSAAPIAGQMQSWGAAGLAIEEIRLAPPRARLAAYLDAQGPSAAHAVDSHYRSSNFNDLSYEPESVSHFVADRLCALAPGAPIAWVGADRRLIEWTRRRLAGLGRTPTFLLAGPVSEDGAGLGEPAGLARLLGEARGFVFAFGAPGLGMLRPYDRHPESFTPGPAEMAQLDVLGLLRAVVAADALSPAAREGPFVLVNAINNEFERVARQVVAGSLAPFITRLRDGRLKPRAEGYDIAADHLTRANGVALEAGALAIPAGLRGPVLFDGPGFDLAPGSYSFSVRCDGVGLEGAMRLASLGLEAIVGDEVRAGATVRAGPTPSIRRLTFTVTEADLAKRRIGPVNIRVSTSGRSPLTIRAMRIDALGPPTMT